MQCLGKSHNAILDFFIKEGGKGVPLYRCAQDLSGTVNMRELVDGCADLEALGLLRNIGTGTKVLKLSAAGIGDVRGGYFSEHGQGGDGLEAMEKKLQQLERKHEAAVKKAEGMERELGGLAKRSK